MPRKLPALQLYTGDWKKDPALSMCPPLARGVWIDMLCAMHDDNRSGVLSGPLDRMAQTCRCNVAELKKALTYLIHTKTADIYVDNKGTQTDLSQICPPICPGNVPDLSPHLSAGCHTNVTVINRRMNREFIEREKANERKRLQREKKRNQRKNEPKNEGVSRSCHGNVTLYSSSSSSTSVNSTPLCPPTDPVTISDPAAEFEAAKKAMDNAKPETGLPAEGQVHAILCLFQALHRDVHDSDSYLIQPWDKRNLKDALEYADFYELERKVRQYFKRRLKQHTVKGLLGLTGKKDEAEEVEFALY